MNVALTATALRDTSEQRALVTFRLVQQTYALPVEPIAQIIPMLTITPIPQVSDVVEGVINVHGAAVPVVNLRRHLDLAEAPLQLDTPIILVHFDQQMVGLIVDEVTDVLSLPLDRIVRPVDILPEELHDAFILEGLAHVSDGVVLMLDPDHLFRPDQAQALAQAAEFLDKLLAEGSLDAWLVETLLETGNEKAPGESPVETQSEPARTRRKRRSRTKEASEEALPQPMRTRRKKHRRTKKASEESPSDGPAREVEP